MALEYVCDVVALKPSDCLNGYTHRASLYRVDRKARELRGNELGTSADAARMRLAGLIPCLSADDARNDGRVRNAMLTAIEAAGKEAVTI